MLHYHKKLHWRVPLCYITIRNCTGRWGIQLIGMSSIPKSSLAHPPFLRCRRSYEHISSRKYERSLSLPVQLLMVPPLRFELRLYGF